MLAQFASISCAHAIGSYFDIYCGRGDSALPTDPVAAEKYYKLALAEALTGDDPQADTALAICGLAKAYVSQMRKEEARDLLLDGLKQKVVRTSSRSDYPTRESWELLGSIECELGDYKAAEDAYQKARQVAPSRMLESKVAFPLGLAETANGKKGDGLYHLVFGLQICHPMRNPKTFNEQPYGYSFANPLDAGAFANYFLAQNFRVACLPFLFWDFQHRDAKTLKSPALLKPLILGLHCNDRHLEVKSLIEAATDSPTIRAELNEWAEKFDFSLEASQQLLTEAVDANIEQYGFMSDQAQNARCNYLFLIPDQDKPLDKQESYLKRCVQQAKDRHENTSVNFAQLLTWLAFVNAEKNNYDQALLLQQESMALRSTLAKQGIAQRAIDVSTNLQFLGSLYEKSKKWDKGDAAYRSALGIWEKLSDDRVLSAALVEYGSFLDRAGRREECKQMFQRHVALEAPWWEQNRNKFDVSLQVFTSNAMIGEWPSE